MDMQFSMIFMKQELCLYIVTIGWGTLNLPLFVDEFYHFEIKIQLGFLSAPLHYLMINLFFIPCARCVYDYNNK